ncbi:Gfo/Idh/MocA family protein [Nocardiopsis kunsanensis]|uniref:Gfo/Idh/MocA family oxidoreductase n=1 Tax=Nocardiopsis kunsanensis TaxID=141693 RepID=A0A918XCI7_9ACTN|nr:Gfo/Idh/MocA family oxidoreductase [Nocardiopsis kunsanensis]GHD26410.1 hypothetical protein GCM10007147_24340 [Nocardiopsis kunsanensis]
MNLNPKNIHMAVIGAGGHQASEFFSLYAQSSAVVSAVDTDETARQRTLQLGYRAFASTEELLDEEKVDAAYIAVPHQFHAEIAAALVKRGVTVLEEKPFAVTTMEADALLDIATRKNTPVFTMAQRPFRHTSLQLLASLGSLGDIYSYTYDYSLSLPARTTGWRSRWSTARGGVMLDMAYHQLDLVTFLLGQQSVEAAQISYCYGETRAERLEDTSTILTRSPNGLCTGRITTNRHAHAKSEQLTLYGTRGVAVVDTPKLRLFDRDGSIRWFVEEPNGFQVTTRVMCQEYLANRRNPAYWLPHMQRHRHVVECLDRAYALLAEDRGLEEAQYA